MNKILLSLFSLVSISLSAQTITSDWFFVPGDSFGSIQVNDPDSAELPTSGVDQIWDYSLLTGVPVGDNNIVDPSTFSQASIFPDASAAVGTDGLVEIYYATTGDTLSITGIYQNFQAEVWVDYLPGQGELLAVAPMMLQDTLTHTVSGVVTALGMTQDLVIPQVLSFQGLGEVRMPQGDTINNVAYIKTEVFTGDGLPLANVHLLLKDRFSNPLVQISENFDQNTGAVTRGIFLQSDFTDSPSTSTKDQERLDFVVNSDAQGTVRIKVEEEVDAHIQLINTNGQVVQATQQLLYSGDNQIDFSSIGSSGNYIVFILDKKSGQFYTHRIAIVK